MAQELDVSELRNDLVKALKRCSLSYEQHQLLHGDGIGVLASNVLPRLKRTSFVLGCAVVAFAVLAIQGMVTSGSYIPWLTLGFVFASPLNTRLRKYKLVDRSFSSYLAAVDEAPAMSGALGDELRAGFKLEYEEHKAIRAGDAELAASLIIERCKANTQNAVIYGAISLFVLYCLLLAGSWFSDIPAPAAIVMLLVTGFVFALGILTIALIDRSRILKVRGLLQRHNPQTLDANNQ